MTYKELSSKHQAEVNNFPILFAFSNEQLYEGMEKMNIKSTKELVSIGYGGYIHESKVKEYKAMANRLHDEMQEAYKDDKFLYDAFVYELFNHEYGITYDTTDTLEALNIDELDARMIKILKKACDHVTSNTF